jgi:hypothetical protein
MRVLLCVCVVLVGCGGQGSPTGAAPSPIEAELADEATRRQVDEILERNDKEVDRLIKEGQAAGMEREVRAAVGRLVVAGNARLVAKGELSAATWFEQQVSGKTPAQLIAAFPEE